MRYTMVAIGSTGDVRPYLVLGRELRRRGHEVKIAAFANFESLIVGEGFAFHPLAGDVVNYMEHIMKPGVSGLSYIHELEQAVRHFIGPMLGDLLEACCDAEALVCTFFGSTMYSIAEKYEVPCIQTHYFPMDYNETVPISSAPGLRLGKAWNKTTYKVGYLLINALERKYLTGWRKEQGMRVRKVKPDPDYWINGHQIPVLYAISPLLLPRPLNWGAHIYMTGFWTEDSREDFTPPADLLAFLEEGERPVYIGFGSMVSGDMGETLKLVVEAVEASGVRAVISKGWGGHEMHIDHENIFVADYVPHCWLFPRVSAVVHHGGVGTLCAGLRAGRPTLVIPFGGDQPFWALRTRSMGLGPKPIPRENLTTGKLKKALRDLVENPAYRLAAGAMGEALQKEHGTAKAADIIEEEVTRWRSAPL